MPPKAILILAMVALLIVAVWGLSIAAGPSEDSIDPENTGFVNGIEKTLGALPGVGQTIDPDSIRTSPDCFRGNSFVLDERIQSCRLLIPADVDRMTLANLEPGCSIEISDQPGAIDHTVDRSDANDDGEVRISLTGDGARLDFRLDFPGGTTCRIALAD